MREHFQQSISMKPTCRLGEPIILAYEIQNVSEYEYALLAWHTPLERQVFGFVQVWHGDRVVPYDGRLMKRGNPTTDSYRRIAPHQTIVEELDLSKSFSFEYPGIYTVALNTRFLDAIRQPGGYVTARTNPEHEGFTLDPVSASFELLPDGVARLTIGQQARAQRGARSLTDSASIARDLARSRIAITQETRQLRNALSPQDFPNPLFDSVFQADWDAYAWVNATLAELTSWGPRPENALYAQWFGGDDGGRYQNVIDRLNTIRGMLLTPHTYDLTPDDCVPGAFAYTERGSDTVSLCDGWGTAPLTGMDSKFGTFVHEWSHAVAGTDDVGYGQNDARWFAANAPWDAIRNADNYEYMVETLASRMLTAPVVWPNGKAYFFVAGQYYRYDILADRVDPGYPKPIADNWPGLWADRVDAGVVWPNGKAYFFRDGHYMRYDIAADRVDPEFPLSIADNWPGLGGEKIDAAVVWTDGKAYFFRGSQYWRYDIGADRVDPGYPKAIAGAWPGLWGDGISGAVVWPNRKKAYFFRGWQYIRYDVAADRADGGYPKAIGESWPLLWADRIDAAVFWPNGKAYFFRGSRYMRYDLPTDRVDPEFPLPIVNNWPGLGPGRIDAAVVWTNGKAYFFRDSQYWQYDIATDRVDPGFPKPIEDNFPGLGSEKIDAAVVWPNGKAFFFRGSQYLRYDIATNQVDPGYPLLIEDGWEGLWADRIDAIIVWPNGKAYFFRDGMYTRYDIAADRADPAYPCPIGWNWPGLPGRVR